ncbi:hypothetical protein OSB04_027137 [Centaurea solstitialis]|uniref:Uncharacterized protein n=1 Tax=Centaurea solstitialis TaxID=347529 RepID=A0AA38SRH6_9ASTR|nr:hypothetical protein OSB04_027137 [Centaurea solstitialis]
MSSSYYFCLLLMSFFHLCLSTQNFNHVLCKDDEREALLQFKHGLIDPANKLASWIDEKKECCNWAGIVCDNFTGHVHQIRLRGAGGHCHHHYYTTDENDQVLMPMLRGDLSPSLVQLQQLVHLDLSCNDFGRTQVPRFMGSLKNLRYLNLSSSKFGGIIPPQLGNLSKLEVLDLRRSFDDVFDKEWTWNIEWLSSLRLLHYLDMSGRDLSEPSNWFQVINSLPSLAELHLSGCGLLNLHPHVSSLNTTSLSLLDLSFNEYSNSPMPRWIFSLTSLVSLDLSWCYLQGSPHSSIDSFRNFTSLKFLNVPGNYFMGSSLVLQGLSSIGSNLISLDISSCGVSSSGLAALHNLTSLRSLHLSNNQLTKAIPKSWGTFCKSSSLESLFLLSSHLSGHLPDRLARLIHLVHLSLRQNNIVGIIPDWIGGLALLEVLDLSQNRLTGILPTSLSQLSKLDRLDLSYNQLNGHFPNGICQLSELDLLDLSYNKLNGSIPDCIGQLPKLDRLYLSNNQLNGGLPHSIGQLSQLYSLDFSSNLLTGVVTEAHFANLTRLKYLVGNGNNFIFRPHLANWIPLSSYNPYISTLGV